MLLPDPFDVLEVTLGLDARPVRLEHATVVRTSTQADHGPGNAVHRAEAPDPSTLDATLDDVDQRFPAGNGRLVVPHDEVLATAVAARDDVDARALDVLLLDDPLDTVAGWDRRSDLRLSTPTDDRDWHGVTVLHRHAGSPEEERGRGAADERLRWWVAGTRTQVELGRARALRAERFGTPVGAGVLVWEPRIEVDGAHHGLAVVADVVVHPAHRGLGVGRTLVAALVEQHLVDFPAARVAAVTERSVAARSRGVGQGWRRHAGLLALRRVTA